MDLNKVQLIGNATRDPELRNTPSGQSVTSFGLATNRRWKDQSGDLKEEVEFHNIVAWGRLAENCNKFLRKGSRLYVEGRLKTNSWDDADGNQKRRTEIIMENMILLDRKDSNFSSNDNSTASNSENIPKDENNPDEITMEDVPF